MEAIYKIYFRYYLRTIKDISKLSINLQTIFHTQQSRFSRFTLNTFGFQDIAKTMLENVSIFQNFFICIAITQEP